MNSGSKMVNGVKQFTYMSILIQKMLPFSNLQLITSIFVPKNVSGATTRDPEEAKSWGSFSCF